MRVTRTRIDRSNGTSVAARWDPAGTIELTETFHDRSSSSPESNAPPSDSGSRAASSIFDRASDTAWSICVACLRCCREIERTGTIAANTKATTANAMTTSRRVNPFLYLLRILFVKSERPSSRILYPLILTSNHSQEMQAGEGGSRKLRHLPLGDGAQLRVARQLAHGKHLTCAQGRRAQQIGEQDQIRDPAQFAEFAIEAGALMRLEPERLLPTAA